MFPFTTFRRRLLAGTGLVLVLSGFSLFAVHTWAVRRFVLVQVQVLVRRTQGLQLEADDLDYNLLTSRFELRKVVLKGVRLSDLPAPLQAQRVVVLLPVWRLVRGSFETARIQIDGLSVSWITSRNGRSNWPAFATSGERATGGPMIVVTGSDLVLRDDRNSLLLQLQHGRLSAAWDAAKHGYGIALEGASGRLQWEQRRLALDQFHVKSVFLDDGFTVESMRFVSGESHVDLSGAISGSPARIEASAGLTLNLPQLRQALGLTVPAQGELLAQLKAAGPLEGFQLAADVRSEGLVINGLQFRRPVATASMDTGTGEVRIKSLAAGLLAGQLTASGRVWTGAKPRRSELTASLAGMDIRQAAAIMGAAEFPSRRATLEVSASWPGLNWNRSAISGVARSQLAKVAFQAAVLPGSIQASLDSSVGESTGMRGDLTVHLADRALSGSLQGDTGSLARLSGELEELLARPRGSLTSLAVDGNASWTAVLGGTLQVPTAALQVQAGKLSIGKWTGADLQIHADYSATRIAVSQARLAWAGQEVELKGEIGGTSAEAPLRLEGKLEGRPVAEVFSRLGIAEPVEGAVSGDFRVSGTVASPAAEVSLHSAGLSGFGEQLSQVNADARWQDGELTLSRFGAVQNPEAATPGSIAATGSFAPGTGAYSFDLVGKNVTPAASLIPGGLVAKGTFQLEARGKGVMSDPAFSARLTGSGVRAGAVDLGEMSATVEGAGHKAAVQLSLPALHAEGSSSVSLEGACPFDLELKAQDTRLATTPAASFSAAVRAGGTLSPPQLERAAATISNFRMDAPGSAVQGDGPIELSYADGRIQVGRLELKSGASVMRVSGALPFRDEGTEGSLTLRGTLDLERLAQWLPADSKLQGTVDVDAAVTGSAQRWQPSGSATIREGRLQWQPVPLSLENIGGRLLLADGVIRADQLGANAGKGTVKIEGSLPLRLLSSALPAPPVDEKQPARFSAEVDGLTISAGKGEKEATGSFAWKLTGEAPSFSVGSIQAAVEFGQLELKAQDNSLQQTQPTRLTVAGGVARLERLDIKGRHSSLQASGSLGLTGAFPVQLDAKGTLDLAALAALGGPVEAAGTLGMDVQVKGTLDAPQTHGFIELENARVAMSAPQVQAANLTLRAVLEGERVNFEKLSGTLNGGSFTGGGTLGLSAKGIRDASVFLTGKDIFLEFPTSMKTTSSLDLKLVSRQGGLVLEGQVDVQDGYYESPLDVFSRSERLVNTAPSIEKDSATLPIALDIRVTTRRPLEMNNNFGRLSATADLRLAGPVQKPRLLGNLQLEQDGRLYFGDRTYYIEYGTVRFLDAPRITPQFNIHAYTRAADYTIKLGLTGEISEVTTTFTSDPPLSRDDVIAVLLTGRTVAENKGVDLRSMEAFSLATGAMNASLSSKLHRTLGVSRVSVQPAAIAAESNPGARITITQDFTDAMRLIYSMNLSDSNDQIWVTEYDISRRFTTKAVKESDNTYRGEFRHDVRFGKSSVEVSEAARTAPQVISKVEFSGGGPFAQVELAKKFKVKPGQKYRAQKVRKGAERLGKFLAKKGYLESRVRLEREDQGNNVNLTVRVVLGPTVELAYQGAKMPGKQQARFRKVWQAGISDQQRPQAVKDAVLGYLAEKGYLEAKAESQVTGDDTHRRVLFELQPGTHYHGVKTLVEGAAPDRGKEILSLVSDQHLEPSRNRDPRRVIEAITRFYQQRGYLAAAISPPIHKLDAEKRTGTIVIPVDEGPLFHVGQLQFTGNQSLTADSLLTGLPLQTGAVFEPGRLEPALAAVKLKYGKQGYREARVDFGLARNDESALVNVSFTVVENKQTEIGSVKVEGTRQTSEKFVRDRLLLGEGELADTTKVRESMRNLSQTGAYATADIEFRPPAESGAGDKRVQVADLVVSVGEPKPFRLLYGGLYDTGSGPGFIADFQNHNSLGAGRILGLRTRYDSDTNEIRLYVSRPFWGMHKVSNTASAYFTRETVEGQTTPTQTLGVSLQQDWLLRSKVLLSYGYRFERQRGFVPDPAAPDIPQSIVSVAPATLTISRDSRDSFLDATRGSFISHGIEYAPKLLGSDYPYFRYYLQYFKYFPLTKPRPVPYGEQPHRSHLVFATGTRIGMQKGMNPEGAVLTDRFYAGGGTTIRGFKQDELGPKLANGEPAGGNAVVVLNEELRFPLFWIFDAVGFVDVGNVFPRVSDFKLGELRKTAGFGLRIRNPFIVLRFDYGFKLDRLPGEKLGAFFFSIGQAF